MENDGEVINVTNGPIGTERCAHTHGPSMAGGACAGAASVQRGCGQER
jgi:hypothetical protein